MSTRMLAFLIVCLLAVIALPCQRSDGKIVNPRRTYPFKIDPQTPLHELLPTPPKAKVVLPPVLNEELSKVPVLTFGEPMVKEALLASEYVHALLIANINHLNKKDPDGFMKALIAQRADLRGLPFLLGGDCRMEEHQAMLFSELVLLARKTLRDTPDRLGSTTFCDRFPIHLNRMSKGFDVEPGKAKRADVARATVASLTQMFGAASVDERIALVRYLGTAGPHASHTLAKLAIFSPEEAVQAEAIKGLKPRPLKEYTSILLQGFQYPLPAVSRRAADALVKLRAKYYALADLVAVLEQPDPRTPVKQQLDGKEVSVVRELVRVNHHHNCLLCHAPANVRGVPVDTLTVPVALPGHELVPPSQGGYGGGMSPDIFVRIDVTYLRQDFSMLMKVENAKPWPEMQRFDFMVRTRIVTPAEAKDIETQLATQKTPPHHEAALTALRGLTGFNDVEPTAAAWRRVLKLTK